MTITLDGTNGVTSPGIVGVTDGSNAIAGTVGEFVSSSVTPGTTGVSSTTPTNATSISLTAGDWDVQGNIAFSYAGTTVPTFAGGGINTTSNTLPTFPAWTYIASTINTGSNFNCPVPTTRINVTTTTTVYLVGQTNFTVSTAGIGGFIRARRVR